MISFKLKVYNCFHLYHCESMVHNGLMVKNIIPVNYFILFHSALVHCENPSWYVKKENHHTNSWTFFSIVVNDCHIDRELDQHIISGKFFCVEEYDICKKQ